jgi:hypothetical protein
MMSLFIRTIKVVGVALYLAVVLLTISEATIALVKPCNKVDVYSCPQTVTCELEIGGSALPNGCVPDENGIFNLGDCLVLSSQHSFSCQQKPLGITDAIWNKISGT